jgi:multiple sugar transport system permease protein
MSSMQEAFTIGPALLVKGSGRPPGSRRVHGAEFRWAIAFVLPYAAVFVAFVLYPFGYAVWMASRPALFAELITDQLYLPTVVNTLLFVGFGVNLKMFLALLLSGFFLRRRWWIRALLAIFILPWAVADRPAGANRWPIGGAVRHRRSELVQ